MHRAASAAAAVAGVALLLLAAQSAAQVFPAKPIRLIVPAGPGSPSDLRARQLSSKFPEVLGQPLVVDNRPGGNQFIAAVAAARAPADGHTLFFGNFVSHAYNPWLFREMPYRDQEDFIPVTMISGGPLMLAVSAGLPARNLGELVALARAQPGVLNYATQGTRASPAFLVMEQMRRATGIDVVAVPYKSTGAELPDLVTGQVSIGFNYWPILMPFVRSGKLRVLAVAGAKRLPVAPDVPTFAEGGFPDIENLAWNGIFVPAGTPPAIVVQLNRAFVRVLQMPDIRDQILESGAVVGGDGPEAFAAFVRAERAKWGRIIAQAGIVAE